MSGKIDISGLIELQNKIKALEQRDSTDFLRKCTFEAASRLLEKVRNYTPTGVYPSESGKTGGTLKRGWNMQSIKPMEIQKVGSGTVVTVRVINPVKYASYVEYGHRQKPGRFVPAIGKRLKKSWVEGKFFLTKSEMELESELPGIIERKLERFLTEVLK